jgi:hypothetical protein
MNTITTTNFNFPGQKSVYRGKVREVYNINDDLLVMVATDRLSAFDVVLPNRGHFSIAGPELPGDAHILFRNLFNYSVDRLQGRSIMHKKCFCRFNCGRLYDFGSRNDF